MPRLMSWSILGAGMSILHISACFLHNLVHISEGLLAHITSKPLLQPLQPLPRENKTEANNYRNTPKVFAIFKHKNAHQMPINHFLSFIILFDSMICITLTPGTSLFDFLAECVEIALASSGITTRPQCAPKHMKFERGQWPVSSSYPSGPGICLRGEHDGAGPR